MTAERVIAAISTPPAPAGLGVIRISGESAIQIASKVFRPLSKEKKLEEQQGYTALYGHVFDREGDIDECVALVFRKPHSYTGENVVELSCHGGLYLLQKVLRAVIDAGAFPASAGEFTKRAFANGKLDLTQAEAVMNLIAANGRLAAKTALAVREGAVFKKIEKIKKVLLSAAANLTAYVDYPDDDIPELHEDVLESILDDVNRQLMEMLSTYDAGRIVREGIDTVIVGKPNVGKSTLMNLLTGYERSIVTPIAGTTRDIVEDTIRLGDVVLRISDTAGLHDTEDEVESIGVKRAWEKLKTAALILAVYDGSQPFTEEDRNLADFASKQTAIAIVNKSDLKQKIDYEYIKSNYKHIVIISAQNGSGLNKLEDAIKKITGIEKLNSSETVLANERQRDCVKRCQDCIKEAKEAITSGMTLDAVGVSIDGAISSLLELTGEKTTEAVVNEVFKQFCVGK